LSGVLLHYHRSGVDVPSAVCGYFPAKKLKTNRITRLILLLIWTMSLTQNRY